MRSTNAPPILAVLVLLSASALGAQEAGWDGEAEVGANVFFGSTRQSLVSSRAEAAHADSTWEFEGAGDFTYGRATEEDGESRLTNRSWNTALTVDYLPFATVSWFGFAGLGSSFQRRIDLRGNGGAGVKYTFVRTDGALLDVSLALLAEKTSFDEEVEMLEDGAEDLLARGSTRLRAERTVGDDRIVLESESFYRPVVDDTGDYLVMTTNSATYRLTETFGLKLSLIDIYDSRAEERGAVSDHDGHLLFSLVGTF